jgi:hypothetical protein
VVQAFGSRQFSLSSVRRSQRFSQLDSNIPAGLRVEQVMSTDASLTVDVDQLPWDVNTLQALVVQLVAALQQSQARITQLDVILLKQCCFILLKDRQT